MPCMDSSGELTQTAGTILAAMAHPAALDQVAAKTGLPLYRVRSAARELVDAGLAEERNGIYVAVDVGRAALGKTSSAT